MINFRFYYNLLQIGVLKKELESVRKHRKQYRNRRVSVPVPVVSLVWNLSFVECLYTMLKRMENLYISAYCFRLDTQMPEKVHFLTS